MEHFYQNIQGWFDYEELYKTVVENGAHNSHFVEIGAWKGKSTSFMAVEIINSTKKIRFDSIDTWKGSTEHNLHNSEQQEDLYLAFIKNIESVRTAVNPIRTTSFHAAKLYKDDSLDFVYIDASHEYDSVKTDMHVWYPKVKMGGTLAGHDYHPNWPEVKRAVNDFFPTGNFDTLGYSWIHKKI